MAKMSKKSLQLLMSAMHSHSTANEKLFATPCDHDYEIWQRMRDDNLKALTGYTYKEISKLLYGY